MSTKEWKQKNEDKMREYRRNYYHRNKEQEKARIKKTNKKQTERIRAFLTAYRVERGCERCGENHPACLDLHHVDPSLKTITPARMASHQWSAERIEKELENCIVLCSNCHRKEHYKGDSSNG